MEDERECVEGDMRCYLTVRNLQAIILKLGATIRPLTVEKERVNRNLPLT